MPALAPDEVRRVRRAAARQIDIEARVLAAPEAAGVCVPDATLDSAVAEIRSRYGDDEDFGADLLAENRARTIQRAWLRRLGDGPAPARCLPLPNQE